MGMLIFFDWRPGKIIFNGKTFIGHGSKLSVGKSAKLEFGNNVSISAETEIICQRGILMGHFNNGYRSASYQRYKW